MKRLIPAFLILICAAVNAESFNLSDYKGQVVYLDFWASWCGPCRASFPWMDTMQKRYQSQGLQVIAVNLDQESELAAAFLEQFPVNFPIFYDPEGTLAQQYEVTSMPHSFLIDRNGNLVSSHKGFRQTRKSDYEQEIQALLAEGQ